MQGLLERYFRLLSDGLRKEADALRQRCDRKSIHTFRVAVKRLQAFILLVEALQPGQAWPRKSTDRMKRIFKEAGKIRARQVRLALLREFGLIAGNGFPEAWKRKKNKQEKDHLMKAMKKWDERKLLNKLRKNVSLISASIPHAELPGFILNFSKAKIKKAVMLAEKKDFHRARMKLKTARYGLDVISSLPEPTALIATLDPLEQKTGRWHDCLTSARLLDKMQLKPEAQDARDLLTREIARLEYQLRKDFSRLAKIAG